MNLVKGIFAVALLSLSYFSSATPIVNLFVNDPNILVGEQFEIEVRLDNDIVSEELLAYGFALAPVSPLLNYVGYTVGNEFFDVSFAPDSLQGIAFPGVIGSSVTFATLTFEALDIGNVDFSILGIYDGSLSGIYYETLGFDIDATTNFVIEPQVQSANAPPMLIVLTLSMLGLFRYAFVKQNQIH